MSDLNIERFYEAGEHPDGFIKAMKKYNSAEFVITQNVKELHKKLEKLILEGTIERVGNGGEGHYANGNILLREKGDLRYFISLVYRKSPFNNSDFEIHSENKIEDVMEDFKLLTNIRYPDTTIIREKQN